MKEEIQKHYDELVSTLDEMVYLTILLKEIIEKIEDTEENEQKLMELKLDMMYMTVTFQYKKEMVHRFRKEISKIMKTYEIEIDEISSERVHEVLDRIISKTNNK
jgi:predicted RNA-binding protein with EMAP domain